MTNILTGTRELEMTSTAYAQLAAEYYDPFHKTCRNFDAATKTALVRHPVPIPKEGLILEVGSGRGRCQEFLGVPSPRVVQLDYCREMLALTDREPCLLRVPYRGRLTGPDQSSTPSREGTRSGGPMILNRRGPILLQIDTGANG